jgi:NAD(P)-dependent dehydrogenase (short-subunit alcohol dehydrogenase family)
MDGTNALLESSSLARDALSGRTAVVTGAGRGVGLATADALAWLGARVVIAEIDASTGAAAAVSIRRRLGSDEAARFVRTDVGDPDSLARLVADAGPFDIVVNNATVTPFGAVADASLDAWDASYRVNLRGPVALARLTVPGMIERGYGVFVCLSSVGGAYMAPYESFKAAGSELASALDMEVEGTGVFAFAIGPGQVLTPRLEAGVQQLAPLYGLTEAQFMALNADHMISAEEAGVGIAAAVALAERFHGTETSSIAGLTAAGVGRAPVEHASDGGPAGAAPPDGPPAEAAAGLARQVRTTFVEQVEGWRGRGLFERKWMERDFRRQSGLSCDEAVEAMDGLVSALEAGGEPHTRVLAQVSGYYDRYEQLARDNTRDPAALETALAAIDAWRDEIRRLEDALR